MSLSLSTTLNSQILLLSAALLSATVLSACQPFDADKSDKMAQVWTCATEQTPFNYSACRIDSQALTGDHYQLKLFWQDANKQTLLTFDKLIDTLPSTQSLTFAMNAGMYNDSYAPIGYTVIEGQEIRALNLKEGGGNFHLLPNGVLWWDETGKLQITESQALDALIKNDKAQPWYATQSGPMLVIDNKIHPKFNADSQSLKFRNGVGVCSDDSVQMVNSEEPVSFYQFAELFKEELRCPNALFLDGGIASALYAPSIDKHDKKQMGVMIGVVDTQ
ncbi:phosphodiester glycosidase family protein [Psychrobacter sp. 2Y5]|uniref:phosphodiester glycosidase family protein n=1 Tax=unclassified Psychrobacter TaxID=196806 RepID=UPI003F4662A9